MSSDKILLEGIRLEVRVGTSEEERSQPQLCGLDLALETDLKASGKTGKLGDALDYVAVFRAVETLCGGGSFCLLEELAEQVCDKLLSDFPVRTVKLRVRKLNPFSPRLHAVGVEIKRYHKRHKKHHYH